MSDATTMKLKGIEMMQKMFASSAKWSLLGIALLFVSGCGASPENDFGEQAADISEHSVDDGAADVSFDDSVLVSTDEKAVVEEVDPGSVSEENDGYDVDMDEDGIDDHVIMESDGLFFKKGLGDNRYGPRQRIARVEEDTAAYCVKAMPEAGVDRPSFFIYKKVEGEDLFQGFVQKNLGTDSDGHIILAEPESISEDEFDF